MKLPRNGTGTANSLLVVSGVVLGVVFTLTFYRPDGVVEMPERKGKKGEGARIRHMALPPVEGERSGKQLIAEALAEIDPRARAEALRQAGAAAARKDIRDALRQGLRLPVQDRVDFHRGIFGVWSEIDPQAALDHAQSSFTPGMLQSESIGITMNKWGSENPREAWVWAKQHLSGPLKERALTDLMIGWTRRTPRAAADWLESTGLTSQPIVNAVARTWAEQAPRRAADWAQTLPAGLMQNTAETAVAAEWASQDPEAAAVHFEDELSNDNGLNLAIALTDVWGTTDPAATAVWLEGLPPGSNRAEAAGVLASVWGASDIEAAIDWGAGLPDVDMRRNVITHLGTTWGAIEPEKALTWLQGLPASDARDGMTGAFYSWAGTNANGMQNWIAGAPAGDLSDRARRALGDVLTASDPQASMELAMGISQGPRQEEAMGRFFREWRKNDDPSAQQWWIKNGDSLPGGVQERLAQEQARVVRSR